LRWEFVLGKNPPSRLRLTRKHWGLSLGVPKSHHKKVEKTGEVAPERASNPLEKGQNTLDLPLSPVSSPSGDGHAEGSARPFTPRENEAGEQASYQRLKVIDGKIAIDDLQERTKKTVRDVLRASLNDPRIMEFAGISAGPAIPTGTVCSPEEAKFVLQIQATLLTAYASMKLKIPWADCWARVNWNEAEHNLLDPKLAQVMTKYFPEELKANLDWITFLGMWGGMTIVHWGQVSRFAAEREKLGKTSPPITITGPKEETPAGVGDAKPNGDGSKRTDAQTVDAISTASVSGVQP
jgi:hypothetical protein